MLELRGVVRRFDATIAVDHVSAAIADGEMVAVLGRSGAGKSTLLNMINRLIDPSEGEILHGGRDIAKLRGRALLEWRRESAMIFQRFNLVGRLSVLTNVLTGRLAHRRRAGAGHPVWRAAAGDAGAAGEQPVLPGIERPFRHHPRRGRCGRDRLFLMDRMLISAWQEVALIIILILMTVAAIDTLSRALRVRLISGRAGLA